MGAGGFPGPPPMGVVPGPAPPPGSPRELDEVDDDRPGGLRINAQTRAALMQRLAANAGLESRPTVMMMQPAPLPQPPALPQVRGMCISKQSGLQWLGLSKSDDGGVRGDDDAARAAVTATSVAIGASFPSR